MKPRFCAVARKAERGVDMAVSSSTSAGARPERPRRMRRALGLMSGTALDGIDVAVIYTDCDLQVIPGHSLPGGHRREAATAARSYQYRRRRECDVAWGEDGNSRFRYRARQRIDRRLGATAYRSRGGHRRCAGARRPRFGGACPTISSRTFFRAPAAKIARSE